VKRASEKNGEISVAICQNIGQSKLKTFCVCVCEEKGRIGVMGVRAGGPKTG
jgi:hypothetical protein